MGDDDIHLPYRLALSVVRVTGIVEIADDPSTGTPTRSPTGDMTLGVEADPVDLGHAILMRGGGWDERKLDVKLTQDGRLSSSAMELSGAGGAIVAAGAKLLSFGIGLGIAALGVLSAEESDQEQAYRPAHPTWPRAARSCARGSTPCTSSWASSQTKRPLRRRPNEACRCVS